jgi:hypothetical protein
LNISGLSGVSIHNQWETAMINLLRRVRQQYLNEGSYRLYILYALGEILLVMVGILLALQLDSLHQKSVQKQVQIDNIENLFLSINENMQIAPLIDMLEFALEGEQLWIDYLEGTRAYDDSLLNYCYYIGSTAFVNANEGFYKSLQLKGLETIEDRELRSRLSILYEQNFPEIQESMTFFNERFGQDRLEYFKKYFTLSQELNVRLGQNNHQFDHAMYKTTGIKNQKALESDSNFLEFVTISKLFHSNSLVHLQRISESINKLNTRLYYELNFLKYRTPKKTKVTLTLKGYEDANEVLVSGDFNSWRPDGSMILTPSGWERSFYLFPGSYEYKFVINGDEWILDPANPDTVYVPEVNSVNSVLTLTE